MKGTVLALAFTLLACSHGSGPVGPGVPLTGQALINTQPQPCSPVLRETTWRNSGADLRIRSLTLWIGTDYGLLGDLGFGVYRASDGAALLPAGSLDRYRPPATQRDLYIDKAFTPDFFEVAHGDSLILQYTCGAVVPITDPHIHLALTVWTER